MFPSIPDFPPLVGNDARREVFGDIQYVSAPIKGNPENISIQGAWARDNLCVIEIPQLIGIAGASATGKVQCHRLVADPIRFMFVEFEQEGLLDDLHSWDGMFCPRFVRGSKTVLSNHAFGTAFDVNASWNPLGKPGPSEGELGCLWRLVPIANKHGFYWGGHYKKRPDPMHFEFSRR